MHVQTFVLHYIRSLFEISFGYGVSYIGYMYVNSFIRLQWNNCW